ncbi:hypothetical protein [Phycicoccus sp.]|uniref:hypothetical protein n=1 Tax=Phycicoccus sp. TaxID=1902410 RepID=UPI002CDE2838|nr:hypothetical protein [Phycicoccus sp.]HMM95398.1 hypothetical protein [Phycicoccus sp.]
MPTLSEQVVNVAAIRAGKDAFTTQEALRAASLADELIDTLEIKLNRWLYPRSVTEVYTVPASGRITLNRGPVVSITSVGYVGGAPFAGLTDPLALFDVAEAWIPGARVNVTYVAGEEPGDGIVGQLADIIARTILAGVKASSGVIKSYSVEGTSITYGNVSDGGDGGSGRITVGTLTAFKRLRRRVLLL